MFSTSGSNDGERSKRTEKLSSSVLPMTSLRAFNIAMKQSGFWRNCASALRGLAALRNRTDETAGTANREHLTFWDLRTVAGKPGRGISRYCDRRCARGGKPSCGL